MLMFSKESRYAIPKIGDVSVSVVPQEEILATNHDATIYQQRIDYINTLHFDVIVTQSAGNRVLLKSAEKTKEFRTDRAPCLTIKTYVKFNSSQASILHAQANSLKSDDAYVASVDDQIAMLLAKDSEVYKEAYLTIPKDSPNAYYGRQDSSRAITMKTFCIEHRIYEENLIDNNGSLYVPTLDIMVSKDSSDPRLHHPRSVRGRSAIRASHQSKSLTYSVQIIDPYHKIGDRYVNINGQPYYVPAISLDGWPDGVYVWHGVSPSDLDNFTENFKLNKEVTYYRTDEVEKKLPWLFRTSTEAELYGDLGIERQRKHEREMEEAKQSLEQLKMKAAAEKQRLELEKEILSGQFQSEKQERERESQRRKDSYEERSYSRKEMLEILKWLPAVLAAILLIHKKYGN